MRDMREKMEEDERLKVRISQALPCRADDGRVWESFVARREEGVPCIPSHDTRCIQCCVIV
jgi:hypothetical protein